MKSFINKACEEFYDPHMNFIGGVSHPHKFYKNRQVISLNKITFDQNGGLFDGKTSNNGHINYWAESLALDPSKVLVLRFDKVYNEKDGAFRDWFKFWFSYSDEINETIAQVYFWNAQFRVKQKCWAVDVSEYENFDTDLKELMEEFSAYFEYVYNGNTGELLKRNGKGVFSGFPHDKGFVCKTTDNVIRKSNLIGEIDGNRQKPFFDHEQICIFRYCEKTKKNKFVRLIADMEVDVNIVLVRLSPRGGSLIYGLYDLSQEKFISFCYAKSKSSKTYLAEYCNPVNNNGFTIVTENQLNYEREINES